MFLKSFWALSQHAPMCHFITVLNQCIMGIKQCKWMFACLFFLSASAVNCPQNGQLHLMSLLIRPINGLEKWKQKTRTVNNDITSLLIHPIPGFIHGLEKCKQKTRTVNNDITPSGDLLCPCEALIPSGGSRMMSTWDQLKIALLMGPEPPHNIKCPNESLVTLFQSCSLD